MKTTILSIAAAAAITLGTAGAASAAPAANAGLFEGSNAAQTQTVYHGGGYGWHRGHGRRRFCRRLYYKGFVLGNPFARRLYYRLCRRHHRPFYGPYYSY